MRDGGWVGGMRRYLLLFLLLGLVAKQVGERGLARARAALLLLLGHVELLTGEHRRVQDERAARLPW